MNIVEPTFDHFFNADEQSFDLLNLSKNDFTLAELLLINNCKVAKPVIASLITKICDSTQFDKNCAIRGSFLQCLIRHNFCKSIDIKGAYICGVLDLSHSKIDFPIRITHSAFENKPVFEHCTLPNLYLDGCYLPGLNAGAVNCSGEISLKNIYSSGTISLTAGHIGCELTLAGAKICVEKDECIIADRLTCGGSIFLKYLQTNGNITFIGSNIDGSLYCEGVHFMCPNPDKPKENNVFSVKRMRISGSIFFGSAHRNSQRKYQLKTVTGQVCFVGAHIDGSFHCNVLRANNADGLSFDLERVSVGGSIFITNSKFKGGVSFVGATVNGSMHFQGCHFNSNENQAPSRDQSARNKLVSEFENVSLILKRAVIAKRLKFKKCCIAKATYLNFKHAAVGDFYHDNQGWPNECGFVLLDGFTYKHLNNLTDVNHYILLFKLMPKILNKKAVFWPQPYEHLVSVLRDMGHDDHARLVAIAKQDHFRNFLAHKDCPIPKITKAFKRFWLYIFNVTLRYGYMSSFALGWSLSFVIIGSIIFSYGYATQVLTPSNELVYIHPCYALHPPDTPNIKCVKDWEVVETSTWVSWDTITNFIYTTHLNRYIILGRHESIYGSK